MEQLKNFSLEIMKKARGVKALPAEIILAYVTGLSRKKRLVFQASVQCAPVLKGIKTSNIVTTKKGDWCVLKEELTGTGIACIPLFTGDTTEVVLLYRYNRLAALLLNREVQEFLKEQGYESFGLAAVILELRKRYTEYSFGQAPFPHELGILLDYPLQDVRGFMENHGEGSLFTGYWKVYHNPSRARAVFAAYDKARETAMKEIMKGCTLREVAAEERSKNYG